MNSIVVAGSEDEHPEGSCQNCGDDLSGFVGSYNGQRCDACPRCGEFPYWTGGGTTNETVPELLVCESCDERFVRRVRYTTTKENCGDKERTRVARYGAYPRCGACPELAQAQHYEKAAVRCRERAAEKRASQQRNVAANARRARLAASSRDTATKTAKRKEAES